MSGFSFKIFVSIPVIKGQQFYFQKSFFSGHIAVFIRYYRNYKAPPYYLILVGIIGIFVLCVNQNVDWFFNGKDRPIILPNGADSNQESEYQSGMI